MSWTHTLCHQRSSGALMSCNVWGGVRISPQFFFSRLPFKIHCFIVLFLCRQSGAKKMERWILLHLCQYASTPSPCCPSPYRVKVWPRLHFPICTPLVVPKPCGFVGGQSLTHHPFKFSKVDFGDEKNFLCMVPSRCLTSLPSFSKRQCG